MTTYQDIHWESVNFLKNQLYRRLGSALNNALGRLAIARHVENGQSAQEQFRRAEQGLEIALNLVRAWAALIHVQSGGTIETMQRRTLTPTALPAWLTDHLDAQSAFQVRHTRPLQVHPETFYESLLLLSQLGTAAGSFRHLFSGDAAAGGVWIRAVFAPPPSGFHSGLRSLGASLTPAQGIDGDGTFWLDVLRAMVQVNGGRLTLQNNTQTGEQALAVWLPAAPVEEPRAENLVGSLVSAVGRHDLPGTTPADASTPQAAAPRDETLIVPPPDFKRRLIQIPDFQREPVENASETLIVPPLDLRHRLDVARREADSEPAQDTPRNEAGEQDADTPPEESAPQRTS